jgi:hypothetical protein
MVNELECGEGHGMDVLFTGLAVIGNAGGLLPSTIGSVYT